VHNPRIGSNPTLADSAESRQWLDGLTVPIREASEELRQELAREDTLLEEKEEVE
jgi:hypothetical protein